jgi:hypothetical protein
LKKLSTMNVTKTMLTAFFVLSAFSCKKMDTDVSAETPVNVLKNGLPAINAAAALLENFETGTKASYAAADVTLTTGVWNLNDALLGNTAADRKAGLQSARVRNSGKLTMKFDRTTGAGTVTIKHGLYGTDGTGTWGLWYSTNGGTSYTQAGTSLSTTSTTLATASFTVNIAGTIRFEVRKTDGGTNRINIDDINITDFSANNPAPSLSSTTPNSANAGGAAFTLTATGTNFVSGSTINWNGSPLTTTFMSSTQLTATVPSANIAVAGSANITVFTPAPGGGTTTATTFTINAVGSGTKKFLFDATKAETAGNADWVIDQDNSIPQRIPTPLQSTITASTAETYWTGAISAWGIALVKKGHTVETLPSGSSITYGNTANPQDLANYDVFVVDEPNIRFTAAEKVAILNFVNNGGGLFMVSDHTVSDRNNDGWDSPAIWNDLMNNNTVQNNPFGISIDLTNISQLTANVLAGSSGNAILNGSQGSVSQLDFHNGATLTINPTANANVQGLIWKSGVIQNNSNLMAASSKYGTGRVFVVTDSSPIDDGTAAPGNNVFNGWFTYSHIPLFMNASFWLAKLQ